MAAIKQGAPAGPLPAASSAQAAGPPTPRPAGLDSSARRPRRRGGPARLPGARQGRTRRLLSLPGRMGPQRGRAGRARRRRHCAPEWGKRRGSAAARGVTSRAPARAQTYTEAPLHSSRPPRGPFSRVPSPTSPSAPRPPPPRAVRPRQAATGFLRSLHTHQNRRPAATPGPVVAMASKALAAAQVRRAGLDRCRGGRGRSWPPVMRSPHPPATSRRRRAAACRATRAQVAPLRRLPLPAAPRAALLRRPAALRR
jgi:hypothetical protein